MTQPEQIGEPLSDPLIEAWRAYTIRFATLDDTIRASETPIRDAFAAGWDAARLAAIPATPDVGLPVGAVLAAALMASNYPGDSGEDVDRLIAELAKRGLRLGAIDARPGLDPQIAVEMRKEFDDLRSWVKEFDDGTAATVVRLDDVLDVLADAAALAKDSTSETDQETV